MKKFTKFVYEVRLGGATIATYCIKQDAEEHASACGGTVYTIGAV